MYIYKSENLLKNQSLNDNLYYTLREIFWNSKENSEYGVQASYFRKKLTNDISIEQRKHDFTYVNVLDDEKYVEELLLYLEDFRKKYDCQHYGGMEDWCYCVYKFDHIELNEW
jgi:hypothetical protein